MDTLGTPALVLFDLDDTIFDHALTCRAALGAVRTLVPALQGRPLNLLWGEYHRQLALQSYENTASPSEYDRLRAERFRHLATLGGGELSLADALEVSHRYRAEYQQRRRPVPGAVSMVRRLARRSRIGVVTNNETAEQEEKLRFLHLESYVDPLVASAQVRVAKPDPRIFRIALERAGVRRSHAVMVGDSWTNDVLGARAAGIRPVWFNRFGAARSGRLRPDELRSYRPLAEAERTIRGLARHRRRVAASAL